MVIIIINRNFNGKEDGRVYHLNLNELGMVVHAFNQSTWEMLSMWFKSSGQPCLHSEFKTNLDYMDPVLNKQTNGQKKQI